MKLPFGCVLALLPFAICASGEPSPALPPTIVTFGDSTTALDPSHPVYAALLESELGQRLGLAVKVINAGVRSNTTADAAKRLDRDVLAAAPDLVVIQFGINDAAIDVWKTPPATQPRVPLQEYRANLQHFVTTLRLRGIRVVLMTPNPLAWTPHLIEMYGRPPYDPNNPQGLNVNLSHYVEAMRELAAETKTPLVDVWAMHGAWAKESTQSLLSDGMHPNQRGHELVAHLLADLIINDRLLLAPTSR